MSPLTIEFIRQDQLSAELDQEIDALDHLAFPGEDHDLGIEWALQEWMALGFLDGKLVTQLCLLKREILIGGGEAWVAGVGGVATHPGWQRRGLASTLLRAAETFMRDEIRAPFGLLVCADETQPVYQRCGWRTVAKSLNFTQNGQSLPLHTCVMILSLAEQAWPPGEIDLCGLPW
jgi:GNAT superfamily N-acetyltransferase